MKIMARSHREPGCRPSDDAASRHPGKAASIPRAHYGITRPDMYDVWYALRGIRPALTISVRHRLVEHHAFPASLGTGVVLRRLKQLERVGKVARVTTASRRDHCWTAVDGWPDSQGMEARSAETLGSARKGDSPVGEADAPIPSPTPEP